MYSNSRKVRADALGDADMLDSESSPWVEVDGHPVDWTAANAPALPIVASGCDGCGGRGMLPGSDGPHGIQRCDECQSYGGDCEAATVAAAHVGGYAFALVEADECEAEDPTFIDGECQTCGAERGDH